MYTRNKCMFWASKIWCWTCYKGKNYLKELKFYITSTPHRFVLMNAPARQWGYGGGGRLLQRQSSIVLLLPVCTSHSSPQDVVYSPLHPHLLESAWSCDLFWPMEFSGNLEQSQKHPWKAQPAFILFHKTQWPLCHEVQAVLLQIEPLGMPSPRWDTKKTWGKTQGTTVYRPWWDSYLLTTQPMCQQNTTMWVTPIWLSEELDRRTVQSTHRCMADNK